MPITTTDIYAYWELNEHINKDRQLVLRLFTAAVFPEGVLRQVRDEKIDSVIGEFFIHNTIPGGVHRIAMGTIDKCGNFYPITHSGAIKTGYGLPSRDPRVENLSIKLPLPKHTKLITPPSVISPNGKDPLNLIRWFRLISYFPLPWEKHLISEWILTPWPQPGQTLWEPFSEGLLKLMPTLYSYVSDFDINKFLEDIFIKLREKRKSYFSGSHL